jgi:AAA15 family ATPase/GTPase
LPLYTLFQSDRKNSDGDSEVQDPLQLAVKQIIGDETLQIKFNEIAVEVERKLTEVSTRTLNKLREMNPEIANSLVPIIPSSESLKWKEVFKNVSISSDDNIPVNKRGSGVKRLILLNFFRAEAERRREESNIPSIVYAIEEPETSQHTRHIKQLIRALISLAETLNTQIVITTHSPALVKELNFENLRLISKNNEIKSIQSLNAGQLPYPSLNEVNYLAFSEVSEEYHNELYGYVEAEGLLNEFKNEKQTMNYIKQTRNGCNAVQIILTEYVRHQIHHPENTMNQRFTEEQLCESICMLRDFIHNRE